MSWNINDYESIVLHLKRISGIFKDSGDHYVIFCPFCNDSERKINPTHGHCYISKNIPVFYCHRCNASGNIIKLLLYTEFNDIDIINHIRKIFNYINLISGNYIEKRREKSSFNLFLDDKNILEYNKLIDDIKSKHYLFRKENGAEKYNIFIKYLEKRIGANIDYIKFLIIPELIKIKENYYIAATFKNLFNNSVVSRIIYPESNLRYLKKVKKEYYFFQKNINNIINYSNNCSIYLSEGPFDIINCYIYLFDKNIDRNNSLFVSVNGKNYIAFIDELIKNELLIGKYTFNILVDNDDKNTKEDKFRRVFNILNNKIDFKIIRPIPEVKDFAEFPISY